MKVRYLFEKQASANHMGRQHIIVTRRPAPSLNTTALPPLDSSLSLCLRRAAGQSASTESPRCTDRNVHTPDPSRSSRCILAGQQGPEPCLFWRFIDTGWIRVVELVCPSSHQRGYANVEEDCPQDCRNSEPHPPDEKTSILRRRMKTEKILDAWCWRWSPFRSLRQVPCPDA